MLVAEIDRPATALDLGRAAARQGEQTTMLRVILPAETAVGSAMRTVSLRGQRTRTVRMADPTREDRPR